MAQHRSSSDRSLKARTVVAGVITSGALFVGVPAGMAAATPGSSHVTVQATNKIAKPDPKKAVGVAVTKFLTNPKNAPLLGAAFGAIGKLPPEKQAKVIGGFVKVAGELGIDPAVLGGVLGH